jgi:hypothetical protein
MDGLCQEPIREDLKMINRGTRVRRVTRFAIGLTVLLGSSIASPQVPRPPILLDATLPAPGDAIHDITRLPLDASGFHDLQAIVVGEQAYSSARFVYVDPTLGNDATATVYSRGAFPNMFNPTGAVSAYRTVAAANAQRRANAPDVILLKRGEVFASLPSFNISGSSATARAIVAAYGAGPRPAFPNLTASAGSVRFVIVADLNLTGSANTTAINLTPGTAEISHILFENLYVRGHKKGFVGENRSANPNLLNNIVFHRNIFYRNVGATEPNNSQALYNRRNDNATLDQNIFIENGWDGVNVATKDALSRHVYVDDCRLMLVRENVMIRPASEQIQFRANSHGPGAERRDQGTMQNNLFLDAGLHVLLAENDGDVQMRFVDNVVQGTLIDSNPVGYAGKALQLEGAANVLINRNLFVQSDVVGRDWPYWPQAISFWQGNNSQIEVTSNVAIESGLFDFVGSSSTSSNLTITGNRVSASVGNLLQHSGTTATFTANQFFGGDSAPLRFNGTDYSFTGWQSMMAGASGNSWTATPLPSPPTIESYLTARGLGSSLSSYMAALLAQDRNNWNSRLEAASVNDWMRAQVGL